MFRLLKLYGPIQFAKFIYYELFYKFYNQFLLGSFSQSREDRLIDSYFRGRKRGFYVDVGANDPRRFNNTYLFYKKGWRGVNIEPDLNLYKKLFALRPKDVNINCGIGIKKSSASFYRFASDTLSTFSQKKAKRYIKDGFELVDKVAVPILPLSALLKSRGVEKIDFMSIDTEGYDLEVLKSNDWKRYKPKLICVEVGERRLKVSKIVKIDKKIKKLLEKHGYNELYNNGVNAIFVLS